MKSKEKRNKINKEGALNDIESNIGKRFYFKDKKVVRRITSLQKLGGIAEYHYEYYDVEGDRRAVEYEGCALFIFFATYAKE